MDRTTDKAEANRDGDAERDDRLGLVLQLLVVQGEQTRSILQILTAEKPNDGPSLATQVGELIGRLDDQTRYLKELILAIGKLGQDSGTSHQKSCHAELLGRRKAALDPA